ncbi:MAG: MopE-related protein [Chitinophagales bacterium]
MRKRFLLLSLVAAAFGLTSVNAQLYNYTTDLSGVPASVASNTSASNLGRVNGALAATGCPDGFNSNKFSEATTYASTRPAMEFSITPNSGYQLNVTSLSVDARHNNKGPVLWRLAYSTDGGATWVDNGTDGSVGSVACGSSTAISWDMTDFSTYSTLMVRIYAYASASNLNGVATAKNVVLGGSVSFADVDGDGYTSDVDCQDNNAAINPGAAEICNGIDENCDGNIDEGVQTTYYADADGDTYGDAGSTTMACSMPEGYVEDATDCNDGDAAINPAATEVCNGVDDNCDGNIDEGLTFTTYYADADGDTYGDAGSSTSTCDGAPEGYVSDATDCNDADAAVNPGATEVCNGIDDNCDGNIDEGLTFTTYYADADGDTYGDAGSSTTTCDGAPEGYVSDATDCNDADAAVNPGATEVCNGIDDNCDGNIDEGVQNTYYADADGDSYGDAGSTTMACSAPEGYVSDATDCNDGDASVNPAGTEVCNGIDDNCDGNIDEGVQSTFYADADGDGYGDAASTTMACEAPVGYTADATDCNDADDTVNPGATDYCNGVDDNCDGNIDEDVLITFYADVDGDTHGDAYSTTDACSAPSGYVSSNDDCNDASATVYPGAVEICGNGIDDDCDGGIDVISTIEADGPTTICLGNSVNLNSTTVGTGYNYQWMKNGSNIVGATSPTLNVTLQGNYKCKITKGDCISTSSVITVSVNLTPNATIATLDGTDLCGKTYVRLRANSGAGLTYQWYLDGEIIEGATANVYYASIPGDFYVVVTNANGCSKESAHVAVISSCRLAEEGGMAFNLMPNPSNGNFELNVDMGNDFDGAAMITVLNIAGQQVAQLSGVVTNGKMHTTIQIPQVAGIYMVVAEINGVQITEQIMITE